MNADNSIPIASLAGKTAMVTGSSSGIGRAIAVSLAQHGVNTVIHCRRESEKIRAVQSEIKKLGVDCHVVFQDFFDAPDWDAMVADAWNWKGSVDFWINNAGGDVLTGTWPAQSFEDKLKFLWQVDVNSTLMLSRRAGSKMSEHFSEAGQGVILNMGWDQAWQGMEGDSGELFSTTKGAIMAMTKSLAHSLSPTVRVNCIAPGWIKTEWGEQASDYWSQRATQDSLMERWGSPADIAGVALFLCSPAASFISGQIIPVNGGFNNNSD
ncbi:MAG: SDR family oxidoreductase [Mariniblastus sp.]|nr:SDR family oxidoreductase [Mariniblastus sp.]